MFGAYRLKSLTALNIVLSSVAVYNMDDVITIIGLVVGVGNLLIEFLKWWGKNHGGTSKANAIQ